jgi:hydrogenase maturation protein HypF
VDLTVRVADPEGTVVAVGGGCLVNRILRKHLHEDLEKAGYTPLLATAVPPGDGGLAYGQAALAAVGAARGTEPRMA